MTKQTEQTAVQNVITHSDVVTPSANHTFLPFALPDIGQEEIDHVSECLRSGWLTTGPVTKTFESDFAAFVGGDVQAIAVNSATSGLLLALEAFGVGPGDEVITTPHTFSATGMVIVHLGATPVFVDIDPNTFNIDPKKIEAAITPKTKVILPVHFAGLACDMPAIHAIAQKHGLKIVEDAAHALPTVGAEHMVGSGQFADATVFSFYATKTITTGEGGMITTRSQALADRCRVMRLHGISRDVFDRYTASAAEPRWYYEIVAEGYKCNLTDIASAIGIEQLKKAPRFRQRRDAIKNRYMEAFADLPIILPPEAPKGDVHAWHLFAIRLKDNAPITRDEFIVRMQKEFHIQCSVHFIPLMMHPYWQKTWGLKPEQFPESLKAYQHSVSLPIYTRMTDTQLDHVIHAVQTLLA